MAPFHRPTHGTADQRSGGGILTRLQSHASGPISVSDEDTPLSNVNYTSDPRAASDDATRSSIGTILSCFHLGRRGAKDQLNSTKIPGQPDADMANSSPLESNNMPLDFPQQKSQNCDAEMERHDLAWLCDQWASPNTRASPDGSEDEDDATLDHDVFISEDESDAEDPHQCAVLAAYNSGLNQPVFIFSIPDTGAALSVLSYPKACLVNSDNLSNVGTRNLYTATGCVTVHGPIWVAFCLWNHGSRTRYKAPFYVLPSSHGEGRFDAVLNRKLARRLGLVEMRHDSAAEVEALRPRTS